MHTYTHHIGDYTRDTVGLSMLEDGAYRRLMDQSYASELPLPEDLREVYRLARASTPTERKAVDYVLQRYFVLQDDGWHQKRIDNEINAFQGKSEQASHAAALRWERERMRRGIANGNATAYATASADAMRTHSVGNANHLPLTTNQESKPIGSFGTLSGKPDEDPLAPEKPHVNGHDTAKAERLRKWRAEAVAIIHFLNERTGRAYKPDGPNVDMVVGLLKNGAEPLLIRQVIAKKAREWKGDPKMDQYARPKTLFNRTNFSNYAGEIVEPEPEQTP